MEGDRLMTTWNVVLRVEDSDISDPPAWVHKHHQCQECGELMLPEKVVSHLRKLNRFLLPCSCIQEIHNDVDDTEGATFADNRKIPYLINPIQVEVKELKDA